MGKSANWGLKPGAEKITVLLGLRSRFEIVGKVEDFEAEEVAEEVSEEPTSIEEVVADSEEK